MELGCPGLLPPETRSYSQARQTSASGVRAPGTSTQPNWSRKYTSLLPFLILTVPGFLHKSSSRCTRRSLVLVLPVSEEAGTSPRSEPPETDRSLQRWGGEERKERERGGGSVTLTALFRGGFRRAQRKPGPGKNPVPQKPQLCGRRTRRRSAPPPTRSSQSRGRRSAVETRHDLC